MRNVFNTPPGFYESGFLAITGDHINPLPAPLTNLGKWGLIYNNVGNQSLSYWSTVGKTYCSCLLYYFVIGVYKEKILNG